MIQTSQAWKNYAKDNSIYHIKAVLTSADGTVLNLTDEDFMMGSVSVEDSISDYASFNVGSVITNKFKGTLNNTEYKFDDFNFRNATISVQFGIIYDDESEEWINRGIYRVEQPDSLGNTIQLEAYDLMDKMNTYYIGKSLSSREVSTTNLFVTEDAHSGYWLNDDNTTTETGNGYYSDYISVTNGTSYVVGSTYGNILCYDSNKTFLGVVPLTYINDLGLLFTASIDGQTVSYIRKNGYEEELESDFVCELLGAFSDITFPINSDDLVEILADYCGVPVSGSFWTGSSWIIDEFDYEETTTCRQVLSWILQISGKYGRMNEDGELVCKNIDANVCANNFGTVEQFFDPWGSNMLDSLNANQIYYGYYTDPRTGNVSQRSYFYTTDYISVSNATAYYCGSNMEIPLYNSSKTYIGYVKPQLYENGVYRFNTYVPNNAVAYIRFNSGYASTAFLTQSYTTKMCFVEGGLFTNWHQTNPYTEDGGEYMSGAKFEVSNVMRSKVSVRDISITGVCAYANTDSEESDFAIAGTDGYMLTLSDNPLITTDNMNSIASVVYNSLKYIKFRIFNASALISPDIEAGDSCVVADYRGRLYASLITNMTYKLSGASEISADAETIEDNENQVANSYTQIMSSATSTAISISKGYSDSKLAEAESYSDGKLQEAKDYTDAKLTKRAWDITNLNTATIYYNDVVVVNGVAMGGIKFKFNSSVSGWQQLGTTTDIPNNDVTVPLINLSSATWLGELQVRTDGTVTAYYASAYANDAFANIVYDIANS